MDRINGPRTLEALCENIMNYTLSIQWNFHGQLMNLQVTIIMVTKLYAPDLFDTG